MTGSFSCPAPDRKQACPVPFGKYGPFEMWEAGMEQPPVLPAHTEQLLPPPGGCGLYAQRLWKVVTPERIHIVPVRFRMNPIQQRKRTFIKSDRFRMAASTELEHPCFQLHILLRMPNQLRYTKAPYQIPKLRSLPSKCRIAAGTHRSQKAFLPAFPA